MALKETTEMRPRPSRPLNNHKQTLPQPAAVRITRAFKLVYTSTKSLFHLLSGLASGLLFFLKALLILVLAIFILSWVWGDDSITIASFIDISASPSENTTPNNTDFSVVLF